MNRLIGIFWGAFDPPTSAHLKIISDALLKLSLDKLIVIVNNHSYKKYAFPLSERIQMITDALDPQSLSKTEILFQDDSHKLDFPFLTEKFQKPLCAIAGSDAYLSWIKHSTQKERELYDTIAVIPRGKLPFKLQDTNAVLLPIEDSYRDISSTQLKKGSSCT